MQKIINWLEMKRIDLRNIWDQKCNEMDVSEMDDYIGYERAIQDTLDFIKSIKND